MKTKLNAAISQLKAGKTPEGDFWFSWHSPTTPEIWGEFLETFVKENFLYIHQKVDIVQKDWTEGEGTTFKYVHLLSITFSNLSKKQRKNGLFNPLGNLAKVENNSIEFIHRW